LQTGEPYQNEYRFKGADGTYHWYLSRAVPARDAQGQIIKWFGTSTDIDDQKRAARAMEVLAEASAVLSSSLDYEETVAGVARMVVPDLADWCAVDVLDPDGDLQRLAVAHVDPAKAQWAYELYQRFPPNKDAPTGAYNTLRTGETEFIPEVTEEMLAAVTDPELRPIIDTIGFTSVITAPMMVRARPVGVLTLVSAESRRQYTAADVRLAEDLARRAAVAIDNARLYQEAQQAVHMRDQFLSIAAHELKTPLTSLLGYTQLVQRRTQREGTLNERDQRALTLVSDQAARLNRMVSSLLDLSRLESGQLSIERAPVDLRALTQRLIEEVQPSLSQHRLVLDAPALPLMIEGDALRLEQVLQNLIQNAVKYDPQGGVITVQVSRQGDTACIAVTDQGIGIPAQALPNLFSRFYRAPNVNPQQISGMGLGLYVVKEIVALHGGTVNVTSTEGQGSTFTICLPRLQGEGSSEPAPATAQEPAS
jgi:signal transduction histidine kinase